MRSLPVGNFGPEQQSGVVAEVTRDDGWAIVVDVDQRAARDLDADEHGLHEAPGCLGCPLRDIGRRVLRQAARRTRPRWPRIRCANTGAATAVPAPFVRTHGMIEDRPHEALRAELLAERRGYPADLPAGDGVAPQGNSLVLAAIGRVEILRARRRDTSSTSRRNGAPLRIRRPPSWRRTRGRKQRKPICEPLSSLGRAGSVI